MAKSKPTREKKEETTEEFMNRVNRLKKQAGKHSGLKRRGRMARYR